MTRFCSNASNLPIAPAPSSKLKRSAFSTIRSRFVDLGRTMVPCCRFQRSKTWAGVLETCLATSTTTGLLQSLSLGQRAVRLDRDSLFRTVAAGIPSLEEWGQLDLIDRGDDFGSRQQLFEMRTKEIAHADRLDSTFAGQLLQRPPRLESAVGNRPVEQVEIDVIETQSRQAGVKRFERGLVTLVIVPELGRHKDLVARDAAAPDRVTHVAFVSVDARGVDMAVARLERGFHRRARFLSRAGFENAQTEARNHDAVVEGQCLFHRGLCAQPTAK